MSSKKELRQIVGRELIRGAAIRVITESKQKSSMRKIAVFAQIAPPSIYYYFKSKQELNQEIFKHIFFDDSKFSLQHMIKTFKDKPIFFNVLFNDGEHNVDLNQIDWGEIDVDDEYKTYSEFHEYLNSAIGNLNRELSHVK